MVGVTKAEASWPAPRPLPLQRRIRPPTIDHPQRLWVRGAQSRPAHLRFFSKKLEGVLENREGREFSNERARSVKTEFQPYRRTFCGLTIADGDQAADNVDALCA
jgi:hypothetical protein